MRYRLRTLLILVAILPPLLAIGWLKVSEWNAQRQRRAAELQGRPAISFYFPAAGPVQIEGQCPAPTSASGFLNKQSEEQVFSVYFGFTR